MHLDNNPLLVSQKHIHPLNKGIAARKQRVGMEEHSAKRTIWRLKDELEGMSTDGINALGESILLPARLKLQKIMKVLLSKVRFSTIDTHRNIQ